MEEIREVYREHPEYCGLMISNLGGIYMEEFIDSAGHRRKQRTLTLSKSSSGYDKIGTKRYHGFIKNLFIHVLILEAHVGPRPSPEHQACHLDDDKDNNVLSNLEWKREVQNQRMKACATNQYNATRIHHIKNLGARPNHIRRATKGYANKYIVNNVYYMDRWKQNMHRDRRVGINTDLSTDPNSINNIDADTALAQIVWD